MRKSLFVFMFLISFLFILVSSNPSSQAAAQSNLEKGYKPLSAAPNLVFEVASVKRSSSSELGIGLYNYPGARIVTHNTTVRFLIAEAYDIDASQVVGGPAWIDKDCFHVEAKADDSVASRYTTLHDPLMPPSDEIRQMLQNLLAERFQLKVHVEQKDGQIYELVRNNHPLQLHSPKDKTAFPLMEPVGGRVSQGKGLIGRNISTTEMARWFTDWLRSPVIDKTGIRGTYDFHVETELEGGGLSVFDGLSQSLREVGLALKKTMA